MEGLGWLQGLPPCHFPGAPGHGTIASLRGPGVLSAQWWEATETLLNYSGCTFSKGVCQFLSSHEHGPKRLSKGIDMGQRLKMNSKL